MMLDAVVRCTQRTQGVTAEGKTHMRGRVCVCKRDGERERERDIFLAYRLSTTFMNFVV